MARPRATKGPVTGEIERPSDLSPETRKVDAPSTDPRAAFHALIKVQALERQLAASALRADIAGVVEKTTAAFAMAQAARSAAIASRYRERFAAVLREIPKSEQAAALARLAKEQSDELAAETLLAKRDSDRTKREHIDTLRTVYRVRRSTLRRAQRHERLAFSIHQGRGPSFRARRARYHALPRRLRRTLARRYRLAGAAARTQKRLN